MARFVKGEVVVVPFPFSEDFDVGSLKQRSHIRPNRIFTADSSIILYSIGQLKKNKIDGVIDKIIEILRR